MGCSNVAVVRGDVCDMVVRRLMDTKGSDIDGLLFHTASCEERNCFCLILSRRLGMVVDMLSLA